MAGKKVFTDKELKQLGGSTLEKTLEAIDAGDKEKARKLAIQAQKEYNYLHDGYFTWASGLLTYIYNHWGVDEVEKAERFAHGVEAKLVFKPPEKKDIRSLVENMARTVQGHMQPVTVEEEDDKFLITMHPCGSGQRIIQMGGYETGLAKIKEAHNITWQHKDFPIYCVHCPIIELLSIDNSGGYLGVVREEPYPIESGLCKFVLYKDPDDIPERYYTRIGKKKPAAKKSK
ncbi:MAG: hypothetical protein H6Q39_1097 [Chloroflexi bacterium]|nr:hypothetical protein [Chloroflexota bacterium]